MEGVLPTPGEMIAFGLPLETPRLLLRPMVESDLDEVFAVLSDEVTTAKVSWRQHTRDAARAWLQDRLTAALTYGLPFLVIESRSSQDVVGLCGFFPRGGSPVELGWVVHARHWGQGFAKEAVGAVVRRASEVGLAVYATIRPDNAPSIRVAQSAGLTANGAIEDERGALLVYANQLAQEPS